MEQLQQGFSDSTPKAGSDRFEKWKTFISNISQISPQNSKSIGQVLSNLLKLNINIVQWEGVLRKHSNQSEAVLRNYIFAEIKRII